MKKLLLLFTFFISLQSISQTYRQYFDGNDTINHLVVLFDTTDNNNIWQIGEPQKTLFNSAASTPNVIITDTLNPYPINDTSSFIIKFPIYNYWGVMAIQWMQKLDLDTNYDGGKIEFSIDTGQTWQNAFNNPNVYNMYGFQASNVDTLENGEKVFTGTDTTWRNIWICYDYSWISSYTDTVLLKFTFISDGNNNNKEGWMLDNFKSYSTQVHTVKEYQQTENLKVYPNPTNGEVNIELKRGNKFQIIENLEIINLDGKILKSWKNIPIKYRIDLSDLPKGSYILNINSTLIDEKKKIILH